MITTHERAQEFATDVLRFVGTIGAVVTGKVQVVSKREHPGCADCQGHCSRWNKPRPHGCGTMLFPQVKEPTLNLDGEGTVDGAPAVGAHKASIHYTLPFEPEPMRRRIIRQLAPSAARYL